MEHIGFISETLIRVFGMERVLLFKNNCTFGSNLLWENLYLKHLFN
jgi:hypothetical protein